MFLPSKLAKPLLSIVAGTRIDEPLNTALTIADEMTVGTSDAAIDRRSSLVAFIILGFVQAGIIQGFVQLAGKFELLFVNDFGMGFNSYVKSKREDRTDQTSWISVYVFDKVAGVGKLWRE